MRETKTRSRKPGISKLRDQGPWGPRLSDPQEAAHWPPGLGPANHPPGLEPTRAVRRLAEPGLPGWCIRDWLFGSRRHSRALGHQSRDLGGRYKRPGPEPLGEGTAGTTSPAGTLGGGGNAGTSVCNLSASCTGQIHQG